MKYESSTSYSSKVMTKVKVLKMKVKCHGEGHKVKMFGTDGKVLSQRINM